MRIILYHDHRQVTPIILSLKKSGYYCFNATRLWKWIPIKSNSIYKFKIISLLLCIIKPKAIITFNWISRYETFYYLWSKKTKKSNFIVVQHGSYIGGRISGLKHKCIKCDMFLVWGNYFKQMFLKFRFNKLKNVYCFGNSVYNDLDRNKYSYSSSKIRKVLIVNSGVTKKGEVALKKLINWLENQNLSVKVKLHNHQEKKFGKIHGLNLMNANLYESLRTDEYDLFIIDHSSSLLDAIFFKKRVVFFPQIDRGDIFFMNNYSNYLPFLDCNKINSNLDIDFLYNFINIKKQEELFEEMVHSGNNEHILDYI